MTHLLQRNIGSQSKLHEIEEESEDWSNEEVGAEAEEGKRTPNSKIPTKQPSHPKPKTVSNQKSSSRCVFKLSGLLVRVQQASPSSPGKPKIQAKPGS